MNTIKYFNNEMTVEEYIKMQICKNAGSRNLVMKDELLGLCREKGIPTEMKMTKSTLVDLLVANGESYKDLAVRFGIGVGNYEYQKAFNISREDVRHLEKNGVLKVIGKKDFRAYGKELKASIYDILQYCEMTEEEMKKILELYQRGKR